MDKTYSGYILNAVKYKETDLIVSLLTENGIVSFKVRAGLKIANKFMGKIELYTYGTYTINYQNNVSINFLKEANNIVQIKDLYKDINKLTLLSFVAESILKDEQINNSYELFNEVFQLIQNDYKLVNIVLIILKMHLKNNGAYLEEDCCAKCHSTKGIVAVSYKDGGFLCANCVSVAPNSFKTKEYLLAYRLIMKAKICDSNKFDIDKETALELLKDMFFELEENVGIKINSKSMLLNIL